MNKTIILLAVIAVFGVGIWFFVFSKIPFPLPRNLKLKQTPCLIGNQP